MIYEIKEFTDTQVTAKVLKSGDLDLKIRGNSYKDLFAAASIKEAWDAKNAVNKGLKSSLTLYCLIGQRSDRRFHPNESFDLKVIAGFINSMSFDQVKILHPHSPTSLALIERSEEISHFDFVKKAYDMIGKPLLICPDAGAYKATYEIARSLEADLVPSNKVRVNGEPVIHVQADVQGKDCLIVDDLADGGRTFKNLSKELKNAGAKKVFLYVTHGQFNSGFEELKECIDHIFCTNSYKNIENDFVTQFKLASI